MKNFLFYISILFSSIVFSQSCTHTIRLTDTFGDGWNGGAVSVSVNGLTVLSNITLSTGLGPVNFNFSAASGQTIRVWRTLSGTYPSEMRVQIVNNVGTILLATIQPTTGTATTGGYTCTASCSGGGGGGCINTSPYLSVTAPTTPGVLTISSCTYQSEYNTITSVTAGNQYRSTYNLGGWITVRHTTSNGTVVASGTSPLTWTATVSGTYYIHYNTNSSCGTASSCGTTTIECLSCLPPPAPSNDLVCNATPIVCGQLISGTTVNATNSGTGENGICSVSQTMPGVWYRITGNGQIMTAHLCNTAWDSKISVFSGTSCSALTCVGGNDDNGPLCVGTSASYQWASVVGLNYYILIHGYSVNNSFQMGLTCSTPPPPDPTSITATSNTICVGQSTTLTANGASGTVYWFTGGCGIGQIATGNSISVTPTSTTTYYARNFNGSLFSTNCVSTTITVNPTPSISVTPVTNTICNGSSTQLVTTVSGLPAGSTPTYSWTPSTGLTNPSAPSPYASPSTTQSYQVSVSFNGCSNSTSTTINVNPSLPQVSSISGNNNIIAGTAETYSITPIVGASYVWAYTQTVSAPLWVNIPNSNSPTTTFTWPQTTTNGAVRVTVSNTFGCNTQTQQYVIITIGALPIELLYFGGKPVDKSNLIYWATATEHNTTHFVVEKSENGTTWSELGTVAAAGNSTQELRYDITDNTVKPIYNYYRLTQYDIDGAYETFDPILINNKSSIKIVTRRTNLLGQDIDENATGIILEIYEDGTLKRIIK